MITNIQIGAYLPTTTTDEACQASIPPYGARRNHIELPYHSKLPGISAEPSNLGIASPRSPLLPVTASQDDSAGSCDTLLRVDSSRSATPESVTQRVHQTPEFPFQHHAALQPTLTTSGRKAKACPTATWRRVQSFVMVVTESPVVSSALTAVDVAGQPVIGDYDSSDVGALSWTLSSILGLFLRSGAPGATEENVLACLWLLESFTNSSRSPATIVLGDYLRHLAAFDAGRAEEMAANWKESFCTLRKKVVDAQFELLEGLEWDVKLENGAILHSHRLLFGSLPAVRTETTAAAMAAAAAEAEAWAAAAAAASRKRSWQDPAGACAPQLQAFCSRVLEHSSRIQQSAAKRAAVATAAAELQAKRAASPPLSHMPPPKRQRVVAEKVVPGVYSGGSSAISTVTTTVISN